MAESAKLVRRERLQGLLLTVVAALAALLFAAVVTSILLIVTGSDPFTAFSKMGQYSVDSPNYDDFGALVNVLNWATIYSLSAMAVAIGFRMGMFNIGVEGQYRLGAMMAAVVGGAVTLPIFLHQAVIILVAMAVGGLWAGIAAVLKVTRGVSEVISTIMLNFVAFAIIDFFLQPNWWGVIEPGSNNLRTENIPSSGQVGGISYPSWLPVGGDTTDKVYGLILLAIAVGIAFHLIVNRTRFGFDLRAAGQSKSAAVASGVSAGRMVIAAMLMSGAVAGLVGMPILLGEANHFSLDFPKDIGFTGIAIALLGRNKPMGIAFAALLWAYLNESSQILDLEGIPKELVQIMQGLIVLSVVIAYEVVHRIGLRRQQQVVGAVLGDLEPVGVKA